MTLPEPERPRKPRRRGLFLPWLLALLLVVGLSGGWFWLRGEAVRRMDASVAQLREQGYDAVTRGPFGYAYPKGVDPAIHKRMETALAEVMADPAVQNQIKTLGIVPVHRNGADYKTYLKSIENDLLPILGETGMLKKRG